MPEDEKRDTIDDRIANEMARAEAIEDELKAMFEDGKFTDISLAATKWAQMEGFAGMDIPVIPSQDKDGHAIEIRKPGRAPFITVDFRE